MSEKGDADSELGRSKATVTPSEHLLHLLTIGWSPSAPLIAKYVAENSLGRELSQWQAVQADTAAKAPAKPAGKQK